MQVNSIVGDWGRANLVIKIAQESRKSLTINHIEALTKSTLGAIPTVGIRRGEFTHTQKAATFPTRRANIT